MKKLLALLCVFSMLLGSVAVIPGLADTPAVDLSTLVYDHNADTAGHWNDTDHGNAGQWKNQYRDINGVFHDFPSNKTDVGDGWYAMNLKDPSWVSVEQHCACDDIRAAGSKEYAGSGFTFTAPIGGTVTLSFPAFTHGSENFAAGARFRKTGASSNTGDATIVVYKQGTAEPIFRSAALTKPSGNNIPNNAIADVTGIQLAAGDKLSIMVEYSGTGDGSVGFNPHIAYTAVSLNENARDYYVSVSGQGGNSGADADHPLPGLDAVPWSELLPGDRVLLKKGDSFTGSIRLHDVHGTMLQSVTIGTYGDGAAPRIDAMGQGIWLRGSGAYTSSAVVLYDCSYVTVDGLDIANHDVWTKTQVYTNKTDDSSVAADTVIVRSGVGVSGSSNVELKNLTVHDVAERVVSDSSSVTQTSVAAGTDVPAPAVVNSTGSTTYYISSKSGSDSGDGSQAHPWYSLHKLLTVKLTEGDRVLLEKGSVFENQYIRLVDVAGTAEAPIVIDSYGTGATPVIHTNGEGLWYQNYGRKLDNNTHIWHGYVSSCVNLYDAEYVEIRNIAMTNGGSYGETASPLTGLTTTDAGVVPGETGWNSTGSVGSYSWGKKMNRTGVSAVTQDIGTCDHIYLQNLDIENVYGNVYDKHLNNGGIYFTVAKAANKSSTGAPKFDDVRIEGNYLKRTSRWGIAAAYSVESLEHAGLGNGKKEIDNDIAEEFGQTNLYIGHNYLEEIGGDPITTMYAFQPIIEYNVAVRGAREMVNTYYFQANGRGGGVAAGIWPWKCKLALFEHNECYDMMNTTTVDGKRGVGAHTGTGYGNGDGQPWDADSGDTTIYQYNYSSGNTGGCIMFCAGEAYNSIFRYNISYLDGQAPSGSGTTGVGPIDVASNPNGKLYNNTFIIPQNVPAYYRNGGTLQVENNIFCNAGSSVYAPGWNGGSHVTYDTNLYCGYGNNTGNDAHPVSADKSFVFADPTFANAPTAPLTGDKDGVGNVTGGHEASIRSWARDWESDFDMFQLAAESPALGTGKSLDYTGLTQDSSFGGSQEFAQITADFYGNTLDPSSLSLGAQASSESVRMSYDHNADTEGHWNATDHGNAGSWTSQYRDAAGNFHDFTAGWSTEYNCWAPDDSGYISAEQYCACDDIRDAGSKEYAGSGFTFTAPMAGTVTLSFPAFSHGSTNYASGASFRQSTSYNNSGDTNIVVYKQTASGASVVYTSPALTKPASAANTAGNLNVNTSIPDVTGIKLAEGDKLSVMVQYAGTGNGGVAFNPHILYTALAQNEDARDYYVSTSGKGGNDGSDAEHPLPGLDAVPWSELQPGDRVLLKKGDSFTGSIRLYGVRGTAAQPIVIGTYGDGAAPRIDALGQGIWLKGDGSYASAAIVIYGCSNITVDGLDIANHNVWTKTSVYTQAAGNIAGDTAMERAGVAAVSSMGVKVQNVTTHDVTARVTAEGCAVSQTAVTAGTDVAAPAVTTSAGNTTYYISSKSGSDSNSGTAEATPWYSLHKLLSVKLRPGDRVLLEKGSVFENQYISLVDTAGTAAAPIVIDAYGTGDTPVINTNGNGVWYQNYGASLDNANHLWHGYVSSSVNLYDSEYVEIRNIAMTNGGEYGKTTAFLTEGWDGGTVPGETGYTTASGAVGSYSWGYKMSRTGVSAVTQNIGTCDHIYLENLDITDIYGNVYVKHMNNGGIYFTVADAADRDATGAPKFDDIRIEGCYLKRTSRWGIAVAYSKEALRHNGLKNNQGSIPDETAQTYGQTNVYIGHNYLEEIGGDPITTMYAFKPVVEYNISLRGAREICNAGGGITGFNGYHNDTTYGNNNRGTVAAGIWPWKCKTAMFRYNECYDMMNNAIGNGDGQPWDADYGDTTLYESNYSAGNTGGCIMFCGDQAYNSIFRYNISYNDGTLNRAGPIDMAGNPNGQIYNNTFLMPQDMRAYYRSGGTATAKNNIFCNLGSTEYSPGWTTLSHVTFDNNLYCGFGDSTGNDSNALTADKSAVFADPTFAGAPVAPKSTQVNGLGTVTGKSGRQVRNWSRDWATDFEMFRLAEDSPAITAGVTVGYDGLTQDSSFGAVQVPPTQDFYGASVDDDGVPDLGAQDSGVYSYEVPDVSGGADSDRYDYDRTTTSVAAYGSQQADSGDEGPAANLLDGNAGTIWHTPWTSAAMADPQLWVVLDLGSVKPVSGIRYLPRSSGGKNGTILGYEVYVTDTFTDNSSATWTKVAEGTWANTTAWKAAQFDQPVNARYVKLLATATVGNTNQENKYASGAELRVTFPGVDLSALTAALGPAATAAHNAVVAPGKTEAQVTEGVTFVSSQEDMDALQSAVETGKTVAADPNATQEQVEAAVTALTTAMTKVKTGTLAGLACTITGNDVTVTGKLESGAALYLAEYKSGAMTRVRKVTPSFTETVEVSAQADTVRAFVLGSGLVPTRAPFDLRIPE